MDEIKPKKMTELTVSLAKNIVENTSFIDDDVVLFDNFKHSTQFSTTNRSKSILVGLCTKGSAKYVMNTEEYNIKEGDVVIVGEGQVLGSYESSPDYQGMTVILSAEFFKDMVKNVSYISKLFLFVHSFPVFSLNEEQIKKFKDYFNLIRTKVDDESNIFRRKITMLIINAFMYDIGSELVKMIDIDRKINKRIEKIFNDFITLVKENFKTERRVSWYSKQLCITSKYLSEAVKKVSNRTPNNWIDYYVTLEIRILLKDSTMTIKEITDYLNFPNQSFFGKFFKEHTGISPAKYRKSKI